MRLTRRGLAALVCAVLAAAPSRAQVPEHGPPLALITLRIGAAEEAGFLHDLADYNNRYGFYVVGRPGGPVVEGRGVFLAWFYRDDGATMLISDLAGPERMQAYFYGRPDGTGAAIVSDLARAYATKMGSYKLFGG